MLASAAHPPLGPDTRRRLTLTVNDVVGAVRRHVWIVVGAGLLSLVVLGLFFFTRAETTEPARFRTEVVFSVPSLHPETEEPSPNVPRSLMRNQRELARALETREAALEGAGLEGDVGGVDFDAGFSETESQMRISVTHRDADVSEILAESYASAVLQARRDLVVQESDSRREELATSIDLLRERVQVVEGELGDQATTLPGLTADDEDEDEDEVPIPLVEQPAGIALLNFERAALYRELASLQREAANASVNAVAPSAYAERIGVATTRVTPDTPSPLVPAAAILLGGVVLGLGGAVVTDRLDHTIRNTRAAARAFGAPVLSVIPSRRRGARHAVRDEPGSPRSDAYRALAATSVATDRLPKAIMVTTPRGDAHDVVACNFATALAALGLQVALIATSPRQEWFLDAFDAPDDAPTLSELLARAHRGEIDGDVTTHLPVATDLPELALVRPGEDPQLDLPLDGLPPFLEALSKADIDVAVIAGPALLEDPNATIVAWATGTVLWACQLGDAVAEDATLGASRLELAGVDAFGVASLGAET